MKLNMNLSRKSSRLFVAMTVLLVTVGFIFITNSKALASGYSGISTGETRTVYAGSYILEKDGTNVNQVVYADSSGGKVIKEKKNSGSWQTSYTYTDQLGGTQFALDQSGSALPEYRNGNNLVKLRYFAYGSTIQGPEANTLPVADTYTGQKKDTELDLMYYNARYYDPVRGRFIQADSVNDGLNRYMYVSGNPVNANDPSGNCSLSCLFGKVKNFIVGGPNDNISMQAGFDAQVDYMLSPEYLRDQGIVGAVTTAGMSVYAAPALAPIAMTYLAQAQGWLGSQNVQTAATVSEVADNAAGFSCSAGSQVGCAASAVTGPVSMALGAGSAVGIQELRGGVANNGIYVDKKGQRWDTITGTNLDPVFAVKAVPGWNGSDILPGGMYDGPVTTKYQSSPKLRGVNPSTLSDTSLRIVDQEIVQHVLAGNTGVSRFQSWTGDPGYAYQSYSSQSVYASFQPGELFNPGMLFELYSDHYSAVVGQQYNYDFVNADFPNAIRFNWDRVVTNQDEYLFLGIMPVERINN
ncbi:RHS repeat-associated core domain-containing protein [Candidatus Dojkabacteria bacterium]|uniref:RHS repeat-associated core domain-containing protein n=1 Tax=Candidatus Dojkabacteria bacterium TaxID=2099670 RepID=A0A955L385_9BACT|nr:RHS repeat-associated core domain-containing protein [Candidatus Dojkabacteria bacterium]